MATELTKTVKTPGPGRPQLQLTEAGYDVVREVTAKGLSEREICKRLGINRNTWKRWKDEDEALLDALEDGREELADWIMGKFEEKVNKGDTIALIFLAKAKLGWRDRGDASGSSGPATQVNIHIPPAMTQEEFESVIEVKPGAARTIANRGD